MIHRRLRPVGLTGLLVALSLLSCKDQGTNPPPAKELDSPALLGATVGSQNYIHVFARAGVYAYHCTYHTTAHHREPGTVIVQDGGQDSVFVSIFQGTYQPATVTVRPNGQVRWQNFDDGVHHSVTSD
jgi:plastocyanin